MRLNPCNRLCGYSDARRQAKTAIATSDCKGCRLPTTRMAPDCRLKLWDCSEVGNHHKRNRLRELASLLVHAPRHTIAK
ncbi:unnamed protein product [Lasius platythorax]|uniref:Uncharacterized protein n=1 Tax=Lasius platythorax TaxID=488582 RepID=A0AAV2NWG1_9HYME